MSIRHTIITAIPFLMAINCAVASHLTPDQALRRLENEGMTKIKGRSSGISAKMRYSETIGDLYVFNSERGFMILPDDDRAQPLLAFSDDEEFTVDGNPALEAWLEFYNSELKYIKTLQDGGAIYASTEAGTTITARAAIAPLIKTEWNQEAPYNMLCPKINGHDVVTGCVATAMAQFMKYYNYPAKGKGTHSYFWGPGNETLALDYDTIPFQWDLMTDVYDDQSTEAQKKAVAELMVACGISVDMHYDIGDSGAATTHMGVSLIDIFGYSPSLWMAHRDYYGYDEWIGMIYDELAQGNPVLYSGQGTAGGHQFICDGYQGDGYFHFNWGWGGLSNGYFLLTALNPDDLGVGGGAGGFNSSQIATLGARPAKDGDEPTYLMYNSGAFVPDVTTVSAGDDLRCESIYFNYSMSALPDDARLGMKFTNATTGEVQFVKGPDVSGIKLDEGRYYDIVKFPELADGTYYIIPTLYAGGKWSEVRMPLGNPDRITAVVTDGVAQLGEEPAASITVKDIDVPATIYAAHDFPMQFTAYNDSELEYYANVTPYLYTAAGDAVASSAYRPMDVLPGETEAVDDYVANFAALDNQEFGPGEYLLVFRDANDQDISEPVAVQVDTTTVATVIKVTDFRIDTKSPVEDPTKVVFSFTLTCEQGVYYDSPHVLIFPGDGGYDLDDITSQKYYLIAGQSAQVTVTGDLDKLADRSYIAAVYDDGEEKSDFVRFDIDRSNTGLDEVYNDNETETVIYNLKGIRCAGQLTPGVYIVNGTLRLER